MKPNEIFVGFDMFGNPYLLKACETNYTKNKQSDYEFFKDEYQNFKDWGDVLGISGTPNTVNTYTFKVSGSWDYEHTEWDYNIKLEEID
jgi:hypothetical protein